MASGDAQIDQRAHVQTYSGFLTMLKIGTGIAIVAAAAVIILIAN